MFVISRGYLGLLAFVVRGLKLTNLTTTDFNLQIPYIRVNFIVDLIFHRIIPTNNKLYDNSMWPAIRQLIGYSVNHVKY